MDLGRDYPHSTNIYPFRDNPDVPVRVTFFPVATTRSFVPFAHPFTLRNWDRLEELDVPTFGTKYDAKIYYGGPLPINPPGRPCGTADQWMGGVDYATWLAGGYTCDCPPMVLATYVSSVRSDDGSLVVSPHTGDAELHINTAHQNDWTANQIFQGELVVQSNVFEVANVIPAPVHNNVTVSLAGDDNGLGFLEVDVVPVLGVQTYSALLTIRPSQSVGGTTTFELSSSGAAFLDTALVLFDALNTAHDGQLGTMQPGATTYGGIVDTLDGRKALQVFDQFTDATNTNLPAHVIGPINLLLATWSVPVGTLTIVGNQLVNGAAHSTGLLSVSPGDVELSCLFTIGVSNSTLGLVLAWVDSANFIVVRMGSGGLSITRRVANVETNLVRVVIQLAANTQMLLRAKLKGQLVTALLLTPQGIQLGSVYADLGTVPTPGQVAIDLTLDAAPWFKIDDFKLTES